MATVSLSDGTRSIDLGEDLTAVRLSALDLPLPVYEDTYASSADSEGERKVRSRSKNPTGSFVIHAGGTDAATFYATLDDLQDMLSAIQRGGGTLSYAPPNGDPVIYDLVATRFSAFPQRGVLFSRNLAVDIEVTFECLPYGRLEPITAFTGSTFDGPIDTIDVADIPGHVDALCELTLTDASSEQRDYLELAWEGGIATPGSEPPVSVSTAAMTILGATSTTRSGSISTNVFRYTAVAGATVAVASLGSLTHTGLRRVSVRLYSDTAGAKVRLRWRVGGGAANYGEWATVAGAGIWSDLYLGLINIPEVPEGDHSWEGVIEVQQATASAVVDLDYAYILPGKGYLQVRAGTPIPSSTLTAFDGFDTHSGTLDGNTAPLGGTWDTQPSGLGDADDWTVTGSSAVRAPAAVDGNIVSGRTGAVSLLGSGTLAGIRLESPIYLDETVGVAGGFIARYISAPSFLLAWLEYSSGLFGLPTLTARVGKSISTVSSGAFASLGSATIPFIVTSAPTFALEVNALGVCRLYVDGTLVLTTAPDAVLATAGTIASGGYGIFAASPGGGVGSSHRDFTVTPLATQIPAINDGQSALITSSAALTENPGGTAYGPSPVVAGRYLTLPPATGNDYYSRLVCRARRNDISAGLADDGVADDLTADLVITPRVLLVSGPV